MPGHIAVMAPVFRPQPVTADAGEEMAAIAWSYAAACTLEIEPAIVFHTGFKGGGPNLVENFTAGRYIGVPMLHWHGMSIEPRQAIAAGLDPYPLMLRWLR